METGTSTITAVKGSEDGRSIILRALETEGQPARLVLGDTAANVPALGIATVRLTDGRLEESDGLER